LGKKRHEVDVQQLAREHTTAAVLALVEALRDPRHKVSAAVAILDRGWGRPQQQIVGDRDRPLLVDFKWSDGEPITSLAVRPVIEAAVEVEAEPALAWESD
jgi:hypothetical protein